MARSIALLFLAMLAPHAAWSALPAAKPDDSLGATERIVEARSKAWIAAALAGDADAFRSFATPEYVMLWVDPATNQQPAHWHTRSIDEWADMLRTGRVKYHSVVLRNTTVRINGSVAIFAGEYTQKASGDGSESDESGFFVETWVNRAGQWLAV